MFNLETFRCCRLYQNCVHWKQPFYIVINNTFDTIYIFEIAEIQNLSQYPCLDNWICVTKTFHLHQNYLVDTSFLST